MVNEEFMLLSEEEKQMKFRCALKSKTAGHLLDSELEDIVLSAPLKKQYAIRVYYDANEFKDVLVLPHGVHGRTVLGQVLAGTQDQPGDIYCTERAAAVITKELTNPDGISQIHIFIPPERLQKGIRCL